MHKELKLSPSGKVPYIFPYFVANNLVVPANSNASFGPYVATGITPGTSKSDACWPLVTPQRDLQENASVLNFGYSTITDGVSLNFTNYSAANETICNGGGNYNFLALGVVPPDFPKLYSDFRKSPSGQLVFCYEKITVPTVNVLGLNHATVTVSSECASFRVIGNLNYADYVFAFPTFNPIPVDGAGVELQFNYSYVPANNQINLRFTNPGASARDTIAGDWVFLIVKNDGGLGGYSNPA